MAKATRVLEEIHGDLEAPLLLIRCGKQNYIFFYDNATGTYYIKITQYKS